VRWWVLGLAIGLGGCVAATARGPVSSGLPALGATRLDDHELKEEIYWAAERERFAPEALLAQARDAFRREDWEAAHEASFEILDRHAEAPEASQALWILGVSAATLNELDRAERALIAVVCTEAAPDPVLSGSMNGPALGRVSTCTPTADLDVDETRAWLLLGHVEHDLGHHDAALAAFAQVIRRAPAGSDARSEARWWRAGIASMTRDFALAFQESVALVEEGGREVDVELAVGMAGGLIADDDWNGDGRKDTQSGIGRPIIARWLATRPRTGVRIVAYAMVLFARANRCVEVRRVRARLVQMPDGGPEAARIFGPQIQSCI